MAPDRTKPRPFASKSTPPRRIVPLRSPPELPTALRKRLSAMESHLRALDVKLGGMFAETRNQNDLLRAILRALNTANKS